MECVVSGIRAAFPRGPCDPDGARWRGVVARHLPAQRRRSHRATPAVRGSAKRSRHRVHRERRRPSAQRLRAFLQPKMWGHVRWKDFGETPHSGEVTASDARLQQGERSDAVSTRPREKRRRMERRSSGAAPEPLEDSAGKCDPCVPRETIRKHRLHVLASHCAPGARRCFRGSGC